MALHRSRPGGVRCRSPGPAGARPLPGPGAAQAPQATLRVRAQAATRMIIMRPVDSDDSVFPSQVHHCSCMPVTQGVSGCRLTGTVTADSLARCPGWQPGPPGNVPVIGVIGPPPGVADSESVTGGVPGRQPEPSTKFNSNRDTCATIITASSRWQPSGPVHFRVVLWQVLGVTASTQTVTF